MWPWEHLAFGYLVYSLSHRMLRIRHPTHVGASSLAVGTQLPDLVDKPLAWELQVLPGGRSLAHSLLFALPIVLFLYHLTGRWGRSEVGIGLAVGHLSHLVGDAIYPLVLGGVPDAGFLLWPVLSGTAIAASGGAVGHTWALLVRLVAVLQSPTGPVYFLLEAALLGGALVLWHGDGYPGVPHAGHPQRQSTGD